MTRIEAAQLGKILDTLNSIKSAFDTMQLKLVLVPLGIAIITGISGLLIAYVSALASHYFQKRRESSSADKKVLLETYIALGILNSRLSNVCNTLRQHATLANTAHHTPMSQLITDIFNVKNQEYISARQQVQRGLLYKNWFGDDALIVANNVNNVISAYGVASTELIKLYLNQINQTQFDPAMVELMKAATTLNERFDEIEGHVRERLNNGRNISKSTSQRPIDMNPSSLSTGAKTSNKPSLGHEEQVPPSLQQSGAPVQPPKSRRYHGTVTLDAAQVGRDALRIADGVITHLVGLAGASVRVTLEIDADIPGNASDDLMQTITANGQKLMFKPDSGFKNE